MLHRFGGLLASEGLSGCIPTPPDPNPAESFPTGIGPVCEENED